MTVLGPSRKAGQLKPTLTCATFRDGCIRTIVFSFLSCRQLRILPSIPFWF